MVNLTKDLISRIDKLIAENTGIIPWGAPIPSFGNISTARIATLGLNPSNVEFLDNEGKELVGPRRRFHTLHSLAIDFWDDIKDDHLFRILELCNIYFKKNPYDRWFKKLDFLISGSSNSYYFPSEKACHLDLIPFATFNKWNELSSKQKNTLFEIAGDTLGLLVKGTNISTIIMNGISVVESMERICEIKFDKSNIPSWTLPRANGSGVSGFSFEGNISEIGGVRLNRVIRVIGFNHNIQSSYGVTNDVQLSIRDWITKSLN